MFLALDIGNSLSKAGLYDGDSLVSSFRFSGFKLPEQLPLNASITGCAISSVVPQISDKLAEIITNNTGIIPYSVSRKSKLNILIDYETPNTLGIDRICGSCGAVTLFHQESRNKNYNRNDIIITIDFGTATTINVIKYKAKFTGGIIAPGVSTMFKSLKDNTAMLPEVSLKDYDDIVGNSTKKSIASGVVNSTVGLLDKLVDTLAEGKSAPAFHIFVTGGNAEHFAPFLKFNYSAIPDLVLRGIKTIYGLNCE